MCVKFGNKRFINPSKLQIMELKSGIFSTIVLRKALLVVLAHELSNCKTVSE